MAELIFPLDQNISPGYVKFTPCDQDGRPRPNSQPIRLYLPTGISFGDTAEYENWDAGATGAAFMDNGATGLKSLGTSTYTDMQSLKESGLADFAVADVVKRAGSMAGQARTRTAPNPNTRALFKQVGLRSFQFQFKLLPISKEEARIVEKIVKRFRYGLYPSLVGGAISNSVSLGYNFPSMFLIEMFHGASAGQERLIRPYIKPCFLQAMSTAFNSTTSTILSEEGESPNWSETDIQMTFGEGQTLSKVDIKKGY